MKKYYQTATYYHGQFDSDVESEDDEIEFETHKKDDIVKALREKGRTTVDVDGAEVFDFPFQDSTFQFPHTDYNEVIKPRRATTRREVKEEWKGEKSNKQFGKIHGNWRRNEIDCDHRR